MPQTTVSCVEKRKRPSAACRKTNKRPPYFPFRLACFSVFILCSLESKAKEQFLEGEKLKTHVFQADKHKKAIISAEMAL